MNRSKIIAAVAAAVMVTMQFPNFAVAENSSVTANKNIIAAEDFSDDLEKWETKTGSGFNIAGQKLVFNNMIEKSSSSIIVANDILQDNGEIEFSLNIKCGDYLGFIFRMEDEKTLYTVRFYPQKDKAILYRRVKGGEYIKLKEARVGLEYNKDYRIGVTLIGKTIKVRIDEKEIMQAQDTNLQGGMIGFEGFNSQALIDNIEIFRYDGIEYDVADNVSDKKKFEPKKLYVSPDGNDFTANGTEEKPYKTINEAKTAARKYKRKGLEVNVIFKEGTYPITSTVEFTSADSGTETAPVKYMAEEGAKVVFTGAKKIDTTHFVPVTDSSIIERLPESARRNVVQINLKEEGIPDELIQFAAQGYEDALGVLLKPPMFMLNGIRQRVSRWPNSGYNIIGECEAGGSRSLGGSKDNAGTIYYTQIEPTRWKNADDMYIEGYLGLGWSGEWAKVANIDYSANAIKLRNYTSYGIAKNERWAAINLLEEIDIPGEWFIDRNTNIMYYYPPYDLTAEDDMEVAVLQSNMIYVNEASYIEFDGIEFTMTANKPTVRASDDNSGNGIRVKNSNSLIIKNCTLSHIGMSGIIIGSSNVTVDGCTIIDTGYHGIDVASGDRISLTSNNVVIKNCDISEIARDSGGNGTAGILLRNESVGTIIKNNIIHNCKNSAIKYGGNDHKIIYNEIYNCCTETNDAGAIYAGRSWVDYGNVIQYNFFHDFGDTGHVGKYPASGIMWDDLQSGTDFSYNILAANYKEGAYTYAINLGGGFDNIIKGNTCLNATIGIYAGDRTSTRDVEWVDYGLTTQKMNTVPYTSDIWVKKYPKISEIFPNLEANGGKVLLRNVISDNFTANVDEQKIASAVQEASEISDNVIIGNDMSVFVDAEHLDYRVTAEAKEKHGISDEVLDETFDINTIGITNGKSIDLSSLEFSSTYPYDEMKNIQSNNVEIAWEKAPMADTYRYIVAKDPEFEDIVTEGVTRRTSVSVEGTKRSTTYYWTVYAINGSRQFYSEVESKSGVRSFTTADTDYLDTLQLNEAISMAYEFADECVEGNNPGEFKQGTAELVRQKAEEAELVVYNDNTFQSIIDAENLELRSFLRNIKIAVNAGYTTLNISENSQWVTNREETAVTTADGAMKAVFGGSGGTEVSLKETLSNYNVMCFKAKIDTLKDTWCSFGLRALKEGPMWGQDAYYILVKEDVFELQFHGKVYATAPNNGKLKAGEWYDMQFGSITTENGINMVFVLNGELIFDYLDKNEPQNNPGMFAIYALAGNVIELKEADSVPEGVYNISDKIQQEINKKAEDGDMLDVSHANHSETGEWNNSTSMFGYDYSTVRIAENGTPTSRWLMEAGKEGNDKIYKVSYYHIPHSNGDKNVTVKLGSYAGAYETTVDLSQGTEGFVELGTFRFKSDDYIGKCSIEFIGSGTGVMCLSNVKFEQVDENKYSDMLK